MSFIIKEIPKNCDVPPWEVRRLDCQPPGEAFQSLKKNKFICFLKKTNVEERHMDANDSSVELRGNPFRRGIPHDKTTIDVGKTIDTNGPRYRYISGF